jgi:hypothetical protein
MRSPKTRIVICWALIALFPMPGFATDSDAAMLYTKGTAYLNGGEAPASSAIFPGDIVQTQTQSFVNINASGSNAMIYPESVVKFEGKTISLEHGRINVVTSQAMAVRAGDVIVTPASSAGGEYEVEDLDCSVKITAKRGDVIIDDGSATTLPQGQDTKRDESRNRKHRGCGGGAIPAGQGSVLNSTAARVGTAAIIGGVLTWVFLQDDEPLSPSSPSH